MDPATPQEPTRQELLLSRLTSLCFAAAEDLQTRQLDAETSEEAVRLGAAFQGAARSVRQCLALELKIARFRRDVAREAPEFPLKLEEARRKAAAQRGAISHRRTKINEAIEGLIFNERDDDEACRLSHEFHDWLDEAAERWDFTRADFDQLVEEACRRIGLDPADIAKWAVDDEDDDPAYDLADAAVAAGPQVQWPATHTPDSS